MIDNHMIAHHDAPEAPYACDHCDSGLAEPAEEGVCNFCRHQLGVTWHRCTACQQKCHDDMGVSTCCRKPSYRCDATALELAELATAAALEGCHEIAETLLRLAIVERRYTRPKVHRIAKRECLAEMQEAQ